MHSSTSYVPIAEVNGEWYLPVTLLARLVINALWESTAGSWDNVRGQACQVYS